MERLDPDPETQETEATEMEVRREPQTNSHATVHIESNFLDVKTNPEKKNNSFKGLFWNLLVHFVFVSYFGFATYYYVENSDVLGINWSNGYGLLVILYVTGYGCVLWNRSNKWIKKSLKRKISWKEFKYTTIFKYAVTGISIGGIIVFCILDTKESRHRLIPLIGLALFLIFGYTTSKYPCKIQWRPVISGLILQFLFGLLTIRWSLGRVFFMVLGDKITAFLNFSAAGASFIYGDILVFGKNFSSAQPLEGVDYYFPSSFAFATLPVIFFVSFTVNILYYYGIMQSFVGKLGWGLGALMGTTECESVNSAANIFLGMTESPLLLKPYLQSLTTSELFSVMTSGFATVAGTVLAAYISFGAQASHIITASVMSAPAALCYSKLCWPETEISKSSIADINASMSEHTSVIDSASRGAHQGIEVILGIIANVIAFVAFIAFLNAIVNWLGLLVGFEDISFEYLAGKVFVPLCWAMGVTWSECEYVGHLIALKTIVNEFVAFKQLGIYKAAGLLNPRSEMIATYAICGFSNPGSVGITVGCLSTLIPHSRKTVSDLSIRAFISGAIVCFMTACIAGVLADGSEFGMHR